jgi:DNA-binding MarR family transcriptional regulator
MAAGALVAVAPLVTTWMARLLTSQSPSITVPQYLALRAIARETVSAGELSRRAGVSEAAVSQLLAGLVEARLVERTPVASDRRRQELTLSAAGATALEAAEDCLRDRFVALLRELPHPEADALARALPRVESLLSGSPPPRRPPPPPPRWGPPRR